MKVRKLAVALALAGGLGSGVAQALGLGEIELQSYLNEPMDAEIVLPQSQGVDPGDVFVNIAPERAYQRLGLQRNLFLGKLRFDVATRSDGNLVVNVSSREPLREPYLNFLLELTWPNGRLMREYAVLVDPPVYAEESGVSEQVRAPSTASSAQSRPASSVRNAESARRQARVEQSRSPGYQAGTFGPTGASDTLWTIAATVRPDNRLSMQQVMLALQDLNPNAFIDNNINRLKRGEVLRVPSAEQIRSRTRAEAIRVVAQQNQDFQKPKRTLDATVAQQPQTGAANEAPAGGDELKLLVADNEGGRNEAEGGSAGGDGQLAGGADAGAAVAMEELESARRENSELNTRVDDLQDQVQTLQRLLELKNTQLAEIQQGAANDTGATTVPVTGEDNATDQTEGVADAAPTDESGQQAADSAAAAGEPGAADVAAMGDDQEAASSTEATDAEAQPVAGADATEQAAPSAITEPAEQPEAKLQPKPEPVADKGFPGNVIDAITGNIFYQIALGGGLVILLLLLLLLARRNANREKAFYEQLNSESDGSDDTFDLSLDEDEPEQSGTSDAFEEADQYVAYGRYDQAAQALETAISREPSRTDLRLKLLGVYADNQDRESFEKQFGEIQALDDDEAIAQANDLRSRLEEAESMPSIDDLESQLRFGSFGEESDVSGSFDADESSDTAKDYENAETSDPSDSDVSLSDELLADQYDASREDQVENEFGDFDSDLSDFNLDTLEEAENSADTEVDEVEEDSEGLIEYDLSGLGLPDTKEEADADKTEDESDFSSLEIDLDETEDSLDELEEPSDLSSGDALKSAPETGSTDIDTLDESFLDELDAELDKVADEEDELGGTESEESALDDLELDVSDEDLALMEEFSDSADLAEASLEDEELSLDDELDLEDTLAEDDLADDELPVASDEVRDDTAKSLAADIDESDLGDDDDFDFLAGTDEAATKLDLARAYIEMGDSDGARDILEEVALEGDDEQKTEAQDLLKNMS
ncbi:MAG: FimV family protein [Marinobacter sp.]|uniref:FimV/HubP family polar landmark protein n=1 Tax=Marinobacter sp. TaxID=50741 RepID=UPI001B4CFF2C|nr:FimV/HubP family polar landmark protein [Marinobacter sp.]MBQ0747731.1 FimV family protein [Marinobacter sp.]MBQ0814997.1 FimV family protein [Marinobacter sp.]